MLRPRIVLAALVLALCAPTATWAFNACGHRVIALIAYEQLDDGRRQAVVDLLKQHPRFSEDFLAKMPDDIRKSDGKRKARWILAQASIWPDIARGFRGAARDRFHHPTWHYINKPLFLNDVERAAMKAHLSANLNLNWRPGDDTSDMNVIQALKMIEHRLPANETDAPEKAVLICWLFHLVGDLHQPLHGSSLFTQKRFPNGDKGGNLIPLERGGRNLHSFWDSTLGDSRHLNGVSLRAVEIMQDPRFAKLGEQAADQLDYAVWLDESYEAAKSHGYTETILNAVADNEGRPGRLEKMELPEDYFRKAGNVAQARAAQAGYRLTAMVKKLVEE